MLDKVLGDILLHDAGLGWLLSVPMRGSVWTG
jgi:hypothetical protein